MNPLTHPEKFVKIEKFGITTYRRDVDNCCLLYNDKGILIYDKCGNIERWYINGNMVHERDGLKNYWFKYDDNDLTAFEDDKQITYYIYNDKGQLIGGHAEYKPI